MKRIYVTEVSESRKRKAEEAGASTVWNPMTIKIPARVKEVTAGEGVDVAVEAVGIEATLKDCLASVPVPRKSPRSRNLYGAGSGSLLGFVTRETTMIGANSVNPSLAMSWIESRGVKPESIITKIIPLEQIATSGFEVLIRKTKEEIKILVEP